MEDSELHEQARQLAGELSRRGWRLGCAESCTGGFLAKVLTDLPGSSQWFCGSLVCYANEAKRAVLGVPADLLERHGAVSEACALAMADGACEQLGADLAVAITGIAGPDGGSADKPVGTVWIATVERFGAASARCHRFSGDRDAVRQQAVASAIDALLERLRA